MKDLIHVLCRPLNSHAMKTTFFKKYSFIVCLLGNVFILKHSLQAQERVLLERKTVASHKIEVNPFLYIINSQGRNMHCSPELLDALPVNNTYLFYFYLENTTEDTFTKSIVFGNRYVTAKEIEVFSSKVPKVICYDEPTNTVLLRFSAFEKKVVFFRMKELNRADPKKISVYLVSQGYLNRDQNQTYILQAFFLGLFAFLFLFNLIVFFVTKWRVYLKYAVYIFSSLLYFLYYFGLLQEIFPQLNYLSLNLVYTWYSIIFITYFIFLNEFGDYRRHVPIAHKLLNVGIVFKSSETVLNTFLHVLGIDVIYSKTFIITVLVLEIILMSFILFYILKNKHVRGRIVVLASILLITAAIIEQAKFFQSIDSAYFVELGITAELLVFSAGLGYITKVHYNEKRSAELLYIQQLIDNGKLQAENTLRLEEKVKSRTEELNHEKQVVEKKNRENELLLSMIHHRVKNNLQVISSLLSLQEKSLQNSDAKYAILEGRERVKSMELVHKMLYQENYFSGIEMSAYVYKLFCGLLESFGLKKTEVDLVAEFESITLDVDTAIPLGLIINELIVNTFKHAKPTEKKLELIVIIKENSEQLELYISDNGNGKISDLEVSSSFGLKIIRALIRQLDGSMRVQEKEGLCFYISLKKFKRIDH